VSNCNLPDSEIHVNRPNQGLSSLGPGGGKMRDPGNEVVVIIIVYTQLITHEEQTKTNNNTLTTKIHEKLRKEVEEVVPF